MVEAVFGSQIALPGQAAYDGPFQVLSRQEKWAQLQIGSRVEVVSADCLKPHEGAIPEGAVPPKRGRPPGTGGGGHQ